MRESQYLIFGDGTLTDRDIRYLQAFEQATKITAKRVGGNSRLLEKKIRIEKLLEKW